jgi:hypothetical protein
MFGSESLKTHLQNSPTIEISSLVYAEINMNDPDNILKIGNYRNRHNETIRHDFSEETAETVVPYYYVYTDSDIVVDGGYDENDIPIAFASTQEKVKLYYSLEDCFKQFRPRSGINKAAFYSRKNTHFLHNDSTSMMARPRYYMLDKNDTFKYWSSFRYEAVTNNNEQQMVARGISTTILPNQLENEYRISDAAPFIVYKEEVPINRVVIKMQTHVGTVTNDLSTYYNSDGEFIDDPFYEEEDQVVNRVVPVNWEIQYLDSTNTWQTLKDFSSAYKAVDLPLIGRDGYFELQLNNGVWEPGSESITTDTPVLSNFTDSSLNGTEYLLVKGLRVVVNSISRKDYPLELIELSARLAIDLTDITKTYSIKKVAANLGKTNLPVGELLASTGSITLADYDLAFSLENEDSVIAKRLQRNVQFKFFEIIKNVSSGESVDDVYVPIKTMYADIFPMVDAKTREVSLDLRDLFVQFESLTMPQTFVRNASFSYAVAMVLDSIGFTNYIYKKSPNDDEPIIQDFFVEPNTSVAEVLQDLAVSTQTAMFFDEYNNLVLMSKSYMLPGIGDRPTNTADLVLRGGNDGAALANIIDIQSQDQDIYNGGKITYTERYIQRTVREIRQASLLDNDRVFTYKPVVLWEVSPTEQTKPENGEIQNQSAYSLAAIPLHTDLTSAIPYVDQSNQVKNNVMNLGEGIYWITRYNGYLYANGEIIRFDAVEYSVQGVGNVWISSAEEYAEYFAQIAFNGKIFPTGRVRIFVEPFYEEDGETPKEGNVARHGRGQFNTQIAYHNAGINNSHWSRDTSNINGISMESSILFDVTKKIPTTSNNSAGTFFDSVPSVNTAKKSSQTGIIRNFLSSSYFAEDDPDSPQAKSTATVQSSALVFSGPTISSKPRDFVSYIQKNNLSALVGQNPNHVGTRIRLIGQNSPDSSTQLPSGSFSAGQYGDVKVSANSAGIALMSSKENIGYFFEIAALSSLNIETYAPTDESLSNLMFYKTARNTGNANSQGRASPIPLWYGRSNILVDDGKFVGQYRMATEENPTVYDLAIEYAQTIEPNSKGVPTAGITFYLYLNNKLIGKVTDTENPINISDSLALFVRGSTRAMFENVYALSNNKSANYYNSSETPLSSAALLSKETVIEESFRKYALPEAVSSTYLTGISPVAPKKQLLWFEEFGTIMREMDYFNIRYDKAYPALSAYIAPTFNSTKGYAISGFTPTAYGAEFLVFNITDKAISLDESSGNWLRILGVTFTQQTDRDLTLDEYFAENSNLSDPEFWNGAASGNIVLNKKNYQRIKNSIAKYGKKEFSVDAMYIQNKSIAENTMKFLIKNVTVPKKAVGLEVFGVPHLQLGDIVSFDYQDGTTDIIANSTTRFVVYSIAHNRQGDGIKSTIYVSEVID